MKKGWRVIFGIVLVALVLGLVCIGVGFLTGAELPRIMQNLEDHYQLSSYLEAYSSWIVGIFQNLKNLI